MASVQCKVEIPHVDGLQDQKLTVGRQFILVCDGEFPRDFQTDKAQLVVDAQQKYILHLFKFEYRTPTQADVLVTSYVAAKVKIPDLQITDGTSTLSLGPIEFNVDSVLPAPQPGEQQAPPEPYGPFGPMNIPVPTLYWAILATAIGLVVLFIANKIYRSRQRKSMLTRLKEHDSALSPLAQFHQTLRRLQRENPVFFGVPANREQILAAFETLRRSYLLFLTRQYRVPAFEWGVRLILRDLKKYHPKAHAEYADEIKKLYREFRHGQIDNTKMTESDVLNLSRTTRLLVERLEAQK